MTEVVPEIPDSLQELADKCLPKHVQVVQAILSGNYSSNTAAYSAHYPDADNNSAKTAVARMLTIDNVNELYRSLRDHSFKQNALSRDEAVSILSDIARNSLSDLVTFGSRTFTDDDGEQITVGTWDMKDSSEISPEAFKAITELSSTKEGNKIKVHDQKAAIKQLSDMGGWNSAQEVKHSGKVDSDVKVDLTDDAKSYIDRVMNGDVGK